MRERLTELDRFQLSSDDKAAVRSMREDLATYESGYTKVLNMIQEGKLHTPQECNAKITEYKDPIHRLEDLATELTNRHAEGLVPAVAASAKNTKNQVGNFSSVLVVCDTVVSLVIARGRYKTIEQVVEVVGIH